MTATWKMWLVGASLALGAFACATPPKPPELEAFERLRADPAARTAAKRAPDLVRGADRWLERSREEWNDNDLEESANSALMGQIKLKQALAQAEQDQAKARAAAADAELAQIQEQQARVDRELAALKEQIALLQRLQEQQAQLSAAQQKALAEKQQLAQQLESERLKAAAAEKISAAEIALKTAETVNASTYAKVQFGAATDMLARAQQELAQSQFQAAQTSADMAKKKAEEAAEAARPQYQQESQTAENRARAEALARDAASIPGIVVRREARGTLQRLVLPVPAAALFRARATTISSGRDSVLDEVAKLIKRYPGYPVHVVGYTDSRGKQGELLALSLARAQSVYSALVFRGVDARRLVVSGQGPAEPVSDNRTLSGRASNNRIEIVFLYQ